MSPDLPPTLRQGVDSLLQGVGRSGLAARATALSEGYRAGQGSRVVIRTVEDAAAYAAARLPATYAAVARALAETDDRLVDFQPRSLLDAGSGPGAAGWAACETWSSLQSAVLLDSSRVFLDLAATLSRSGPEVLARSDRRLVDLTRPEASTEPWPQADLVMASYVLAEIAPNRIEAVVEGLWEACTGILVLVEPGSAEGWARIKLARDALIARGGDIIAPCAHAAACPVTAPDWCHFVQRLPRSRDHRQAKMADRSFEDEKFIYLAVCRTNIARRAGGERILAPARQSKIALEFKVCTPSGDSMTRTVPRRDKADYARARRLDWGDLWNSDGE